MLFEQVDAEMLRRSWFRVREREHERTKVEFPVGAKLVTRKVVVRTGYRWQPTDLPVAEENAEVLRRLEPLAGITHKQAVAVMRVLSGESLPYTVPPTGEEVYIDKSVGRKFRYRIRWQWCTEQYRGIEEPMVRTMWYHDLPQGEEWWGRCAAVVRRWVGLYHPADHSRDVQEPAWFESWTLQQLYQVKFENIPPGYQHTLLVHPLDAHER